MSGRATPHLVNTAHYVISRTEPAELGATKLNKILWYADLEHYRRYGRSITTVPNYVRMPRGPVPAGIDDALARLKRNGQITERRSKVYDYERREFVWLKRPPSDMFTVDQVEIIHDFIDLIKDMTAAEISEITHRDALWVELADGEPMSIGAAAVIGRVPSTAELRWAQAAAAL